MGTGSYQPPPRVPIRPLLLGNGVMSTCFDPSDISEMLATVRRSVSWRTEKQHLYCHVLLRVDAQSHEAWLKSDGNIDCPTCGPKRRREEADESTRQFVSDKALFLTLVRPTQQARHAVTKQIGDKEGTGWYIPIIGAFALISDVAIHSRTATPYSIEIHPYEQDGRFFELLAGWWPETGRMTRPRYRKTDADTDSCDPPRKPRVPLGTTNTRYEQNLATASILFVSREDTMRIATRWSAPEHQEALEASGWKPPNNRIDWRPPQELRDTDANAEENPG